MAFIPFFGGKPVNNARIFLETNGGRKLVAFQETGSQGKAGFKFLDAGNYQLLIEFPQQEGKWLKEKQRNSTFTKASYNPKTKTYYYQGEEGFFLVKIRGTKKIDNETFKSVFREKRTDEGLQIIISQFQAKNKGAQISIIINVITAAQFKRFTDKIQRDISTISIPGAR